MAHAMHRAERQEHKSIYRSVTVAQHHLHITASLGSCYPLQHLRPGLRLNERGHHMECRREPTDGLYRPGNLVRWQPHRGLR
jgi:hypothetical protein